MIIVVIFVPRVFTARKETPMGVGIHQHTERHVADLVAALRPPCGGPGRLHRWQEEAHQRADDGDDHEQFHEREAHPDPVSRGKAHRGGRAASSRPVRTTAAFLLHHFFIPQ